MTPANCDTNSLDVTLPLITRVLKKSLAENPLMSVLSKSKNAPMCGPCSPAKISLVMLSVFEPGTISRSIGTLTKTSVGLANVIPCNSLILSVRASIWLINFSTFFLSLISPKLFTNLIPFNKNGFETASILRIRPCQCISSPTNKQYSANLLSSMGWSEFQV